MHQCNIFQRVLNHLKHFFCADVVIQQDVSLIYDVGRVDFLGTVGLRRSGFLGTVYGVRKRSVLKITRVVALSTERTQLIKIQSSKKLTSPNRPRNRKRERAVDTNADAWYPNFVYSDRFYESPQNAKPTNEPSEVAPLVQMIENLDHSNASGGLLSEGGDVAVHPAERRMKPSILPSSAPPKNPKTVVPIKIPKKNVTHPKPRVQRPRAPVRRQPPRPAPGLRFTIEVNKVYHNENAYYYTGPWSTYWGNQRIAQGSVFTYNKNMIADEIRRQLEFFCCEYFD